MTISERIAYIKGLAEGLGLDESKPESRIINELIDALGEIVGELNDTQDDVMLLEEHIDAADEDLDDLETFVYDDVDDDGDSCEVVEEDLYEVECPNCGETICVDEDIVLDGSIDCPNCGEKLEFELLDDECDCGCDGECGHDEKE